MTVVLKNRYALIHIDKPNQNYNHPRFDWTGKIVKVNYKGSILTGYEKENAPADSNIGRGFYNEFGIDRPIGFSECMNGEWFHKIGVGLLKKDGTEYSFDHPYEIKPLEFKIEADSTRAIIRCEGEEVNGYGYQYEKQVILKDHGFKIYYTIMNTGSKIIETDEYNHNFVMLDNDFIGRNYQLNFAFDLLPGEVGETLNPGDIVKIEKSKIEFTYAPSSPLFYSFLNGKSTVPARWEMINFRLGMGIREIGSFHCKKVNLWGWKGALSPELFCEVKVRPGEKQVWTREYQFFTVGKE